MFLVFKVVVDDVMDKILDINVFAVPMPELSSTLKSSSTNICKDMSKQAVQYVKIVSLLVKTNG